MWTVTFRRDWNDVQPRAEKRANKFAGCQVNVEREIREFTINVGAQEIFGRKGAVLGGLDCPGRVARQRRAGDPPEGEKWNRMARRRRAEPLCATNAGANGRRAPRSPMRSIAICGKSCASIARGCGGFTECRITSWVAVSSRPGLCLLRS